jgi:putative hemolysin
MSEANYGYRFLLLALIVALNGFFAASEAAMLSVRKSRLQSLADEGEAGAKIALSLLENPERMLSVTQVGVTLTSLGLGWAGEDTLFQMLIGWLQPVMTTTTTALFHGIAITAAFTVMTYFHVVLGEVVPKNVALASADKLAVLVAPILLVFSRIAGPLVTTIERSANAISARLGVSGETQSSGHSVEELKFIVASSRTEGHLVGFEEDAIRRLLELSNFAAREIMVPRKQMVSVSVSSTLDHVLRQLNEHQYSRLPVYEKAPDHIVGVVHLKDLVQVWMSRRAAPEARRSNARGFDLRKVMRQPLFVPETKSLHELVDEFREHHSHMAIVVDEHGSVAGLVTLEDVLEQVFGEIEDEHDISRPRAAADAQSFEVDGMINIPDLANQYGIELPSDDGYETLAGFLLFELGDLPQVGTQVKHEKLRFTVMEMERNRIARVQVERLGADG